MNHHLETSPCRTLKIPTKTPKSVASDHRGERFAYLARPPGGDARIVFSQPASCRSHGSTTIVARPDQCLDTNARSRMTNALIATLSVIAWFSFSPPLFGQPTPPQTRTSPSELETFFESKIRPLLLQHCVECHGPDDQSGELRLDRQHYFEQGGGSGPLVVDGDPDRSRLLRAVGYQDNELQMPPDSKLPDDAIADLTKWVRSGAFWPDDKSQADTSTETRSPAEQIDEMRLTHWSFRPLTSPNLPPVNSGLSPDTTEVVDTENQSESAIDAFIGNRLHEAGLTPNPRADRRTLIHRAYFTLLGLPPSYEEVQAFLNDDDPNAFARLVDRLLDNPHYGERWARHWLDIARYGDTKGYLAGSRETRYPYAYTYRDYVIDAFNSDKPFDQFIIEQIAADQLEPAGDQLKILAAMGFLTVGRRFMNRQHDIIDDQIDVVTRGFLGLSVACARCHDHKYDPIPTADYYSLYGVFASSQEPAELPMLGKPHASDEYDAFVKEKAAKQENVDRWLEERRVATEHELRSRVADYLVHVAKNLPQYKQGKIPLQGERGALRSAAVQRWQHFLSNPETTSDPIWTLWHRLAAIQADEFALKSAAILDKAATATDPPLKIPQSLINALRESNPQSMLDAAKTLGTCLEEADAQWVREHKENKDLERLTDDNLEELRRVLYASDTPTTLDTAQMIAHLDQGERNQYNSQLSKVNEVDVTHPGAPPRAMVMTDRANPVAPVIFRRGVPGNRGDRVPRRFLQVLSHVDGGEPFQRGSGRLELARAIASPNNPLTARVIVNRIWQHQFGEGLVRTSSDFGFRGEAPTHPELLDHLANEFVADSWSIKRLQRRIMLSSAWQQSSDLRQDAVLIDAENRLLWHMPRRRMEFEPLRDRLLVAAGRLDQRIGGRSVMIHQDATRRGLYAYIDREDLPGLLASFDLPSPDASRAKRTETTVPQQALYLMNSRFVIEQAEALAARTLPGSDPNTHQDGSGSGSPPNDRERVHKLYRLALSRDPDDVELKAALNFVDPASVEEFRQQQERSEAAPPDPWRSGYGYFNVNESKTVFTPFPYFDGQSWQASEQFPDPKLHYLRLSADGGHPGSDNQHAAIRRWTSPFTGIVKITGRLRHVSKKGDGVRASVVHSRFAVQGEWTAQGSDVETPADEIQVQPGDTIDFIVDCLENSSFDSFQWSPSIEATHVTASDDRDDNSSTQTWDASANFITTGKARYAKENQQTPDPWTQLAQVLLLCNEFAFVD